MNRRWVAIVGAAAVVASTLAVGVATPAVAGPCDPGGNPIVCENSKPGSPESEWEVAGAGDPGLQGFATKMSLSAGEQQQFKIKTSGSGYTIDIYRLGWYGGDGARKIGSATPTARTQPNCMTDAPTGLVDCGNWAVSASWTVPADAVSGVYIAHLNNPTNQDESQIPFVVRNDASHSDILFQTSDSTWQAYNTYGGSDFYTGVPDGRAYKISYNRPFVTRGDQEGRDYLFANEYPMLQFMERNGYDVSYMSSLDVDRRGPLLQNHKVFVSTGHDEYWSGAQRANVEAARDAGVNLAFFSGNEVYWRTRWEPSIDGTSTDGRTLVCYKETWANAKIDPTPESTATWRDPRFAPPSQGGGRPENALTGTIYMSNFTDLPITVSEREGKLRVWRNTTLGSMSSGQTTALAAHTIGYESDEDLDNGSRPPGLVRLSTTTGPTPQYLQDYGNTVLPGTTTHHLTLYRAASGALVFGAGTVQWAWGLSQNHDGNGAAADVRIQQATVNIFADMGALASTIMPGLTASTKTTDTTAPTVTISAPADGAAIGNGSVVNVAGTATDVGGKVAGVEVSTDNGTTWHPATGTTSWTYSYVATGRGAATVKARAIDDSANIGTAASRSVTVSCPCSLFGDSVPATPSANDSSSVELGVRFTPTEDGYVSGVRFYKGTGNTGTHTGSLWTASGSLLATGTFTGETANGWQTLQFGESISVAAGTTYVASYRAPSGRYAADSNFFTTKDHVAPPLTALGKPSGQTNGVYGLGPGFPTSSYGDTNYYVDVVFTVDDTTPPIVTSRTPLPGSSSVAPSVKPRAVFSRAIDPTSLQFTVTSAGGPVSGSAAYDAATRTATFTPTANLAYSTAFTVTVQASTVYGVPMDAPATWTFTTSATDPLPGDCPCSIWPDSATPTVLTDSDPRSVELGARFTAEADGEIVGVRFYKGPANVGTHTGSLWTASGQLLASVTVVGETSTGWQNAYFSSPVSIQADTTYVVSYRAPAGSYSYTANGLAAAVDSPPLHT
ncbi:MAG: N,N-dimethylformamidase beta subunit family domain-containing protein, partial [Pedococcus sp.]